MKERVFNSEIRNSLEANGAWAFKIPDMPHFKGMKTRFDIKKPCDIVCMFQEKGILIECKQMKKWESFGMKHMESNQIKNLDRALELKAGRAFVFLNVRIAHKENRCIIFDWAIWKKKLEEKNLTSQELKELEYIGGYKGQFDMSKFLTSIAITRTHVTGKNDDPVQLELKPIPLSNLQKLFKGRKNGKVSLSN